MAPKPPPPWSFTMHYRCHKTQRTDTGTAAGTYYNWIFYHHQDILLPRAPRLEDDRARKEHRVCSSGPGELKELDCLSGIASLGSLELPNLN